MAHLSVYLLRGSHFRDKPRTSKRRTSFDAGPSLRTEDFAQTWLTLLAPPPATSEKKGDTLISGPKSARPRTRDPFPPKRTRTSRNTFTRHQLPHPARAHYL